MSDDKNNNNELAQTAAVGNRKPKKTNPQQAKARASFNAAAPPMSVEKFFSDFTEVRRNNVDVVLDLGFQDREAAPYVARAKDHATYKLDLPEDVTLPSVTYAMISLGIVRKLLLATPVSQSYEVSVMKDFADQDLFLPKASIAAIDNLGKFELDDFVARIKYQTQDVARLLIKMCQVMDGHPRFRNRYIAPQWPVPPHPPRQATWADVDVDAVVVPSRSSALWIRDQAVKYLDEAYKHTWKMTDAEGNEFEVSYPRLELSKSQEAQLRNITDWFAKLSEHMPNVLQMVSAGICSAWDEQWFSSYAWRDLGVDFPTWAPAPLDVLRTMGVWRVSFQAGEFVPFAREILNHLISMKPVFDEFLDLARQPDNKFGTEAQMVYLPDVAFSDKPLYGLPNRVYQGIKRGTQGRSVVKVKNKGLVVAGSILGLTRRVEVTDNYLAQVNGDPDNLRLQYHRSDFKNI